MSLSYWLRIQLKKIFMRKKKTINILTIFSFLIKIMSKFFLIKFLTNILKHLLTLFGKKYPNNINETNSPSPQCLEKCVQVYFGQWVSLVKDKWYLIFWSVLVTCEMYCQLNIWNKSLFTCCHLWLNTELIVFPSSLPLLEEGKQSLEGRRASKGPD